MPWARGRPPLATSFTGSDEWVRSFESTWNARLDRLDDVLAELHAKEK